MAKHELISERKHASQKLGDVLILGLGVSGVEAARYCMALLGVRVNSLTIYGGSPNDASLAFAAECRQQGVEVFFSTEEIEGSFDLCIASPGISQLSSFYQRAQAHANEVISEVEFAWRESAANSIWVAVTGTNGKSTTTALVAHLLQEAGLRAAAVGNIGEACIKAVAEGNTDVYVAEVSSYQLASTVSFAPNVAVLLGITPDHLAWHGSFEAYVEAKMKVFANMVACAGAKAVIDATNAPSRAIYKQLCSEGRCFCIPVGTADGVACDMRKRCGSPNAAFVDDVGQLVVAKDGEEHALIPANALPILGKHNQLNALAAAAAALCVEAKPDAVVQGLKTFKPLEHRIEPCGEVAGVSCYNDSKATNVDATLKALSAFIPKRPIVLLGGDDKGTPLDELVASAQQHCKAVVCFGEAGPRFADAFEYAAIEHPLVGGMEEAFDTALGMADVGDIVLLSPACASFDEFSNFEHRGRVFKELVETRQAQQ